jgi:aryl-alcohol dehydrogenase-like predicted oxidoreductase
VESRDAENAKLKIITSMSNQIVGLSRRPLGRTGIPVTPLGLGGAWLGYQPATGQRDPELGAATVVKALEQGIGLIDTSPGYGESEQIIGKGLAEWYRLGGKRSDFVISSKTGTRTRPYDYTAEGTLRSVEQSLKALGTDYIDVMLVHDPASLDPVFAPGGALEILRQLREQGVIRSIGLGVRNHSFHQRCIESGEFEVSLTYGDYNLLNQTAATDIFPIAAAHQTGVFNAMVVEYGLLSGKDPREVVKERKNQVDPHKLERATELWDWAQTKQVDLLSIALQFSARNPHIHATLVGAATPEEVVADLAVFNQPISPPVWDELHQKFDL